MYGSAGGKHRFSSRGREGGREAGRVEWVPQSHPWPSAVQVQTLLPSCRKSKNIWQKGGKVSSQPPRGKNKQIFLKAVEQHPDHVFAINPELP